MSRTPVSERYRVTIKTRAVPGRIEQEVLWPFPVRDPAGDIIKHVMYLREQSVRDALIAMGWTPPMEPA